MNRRRFSDKERGKKTQTRRPIFLIIAEGKNKTEYNYFFSFRKESNGKIEFVKGGQTDPLGMLKALKKDWKEKELNTELGDRAFVLIDLDAKEERGEAIRDLMQRRSNRNFQFIVSNPCFEVWFLRHFSNSTKSFLDSKKVLKEVRSIWPTYEKSSAVAHLIRDRLDDAMKNERSVAATYFDKRWPSNQCNPRTDVPDIMDFILGN